MGPHNFAEEGPNNATMDNFSPVVYFKNQVTGEIEAYRLMVYIGHKTMIALLFEEKQVFTYDLLNKLDKHLAKHCPVISQLIDIAV